MLLGLDSSSKSSSCALFCDGRLIAESYLDNGLTHSQIAMQQAAAMLKTAGAAESDIDCLCVACGPGSFTGLRIGMSIVKALAFAWSKPVVPVSTLEALSYNLSGFDCTALATLDARCGQFYTAAFELRGGVSNRIWPDSALALPDILKALEAIDGPVQLVGDGAEIFLAQALAAQPWLCEKLRLTEPSLVLTRAAGVCKAAYPLALCGKTVTHQTLAPAYLRLAQAEQKMKI